MYRSYFAALNHNQGLAARRLSVGQRLSWPTVLTGTRAGPDHHQPPHQRCHESCFCLLTPFTLWICASVILRYGYYGNCQMVLGPNTSRLFKASSVFVKQVQAKDYDKKGVFLYEFSEKPYLSLTKNWNLSNYIIVASYSHKGFSLWLNKGSRIIIRWEAQISALGLLEVSLTKGEQKSGTVVATSNTTTSCAHTLREPVAGREVEYTIEEDDKYKIGITNSNRKSVMMVMKLNVSSKIYNTSQAETKCSTLDGSCQINLLFPKTRFVIVTTLNHGDLREWYVELSFVARVITYIVILGLIVVIILIILKYLGVCERDTRDQDESRTIRQVSETDPLMPQKTTGMSYGTGEQDDDCVSSSSSEDLYDGKICVICYEEPRNCFFVPCGHCATCYSCAQRIMDGETKVCPICRRPIHKARKLLIP